jgi:hypothetical protein
VYWSDLGEFKEGVELDAKTHDTAAPRIAKVNGKSVSCDESGNTKFPFSYLAHVTLLTPAQGRLTAAQDWLSLAHPLNHFWKAAL